jgi:hypothetical protein
MVTFFKVNLQIIYPHLLKPLSQPSPRGEGGLRSLPPWGKKKGGKNYYKLNYWLLVTEILKSYTAVRHWVTQGYKEFFTE